MNAMTLDDIEAALRAEVEAASLRHLATVALRRIRAEAEAFLRNGIARLVAARDAMSEADRIRAMLEAATPPEAMAAAPVAPARGPMQLVSEYVQDGNTRELAGQHWRGVDPLSVMCRQARARYDRNPPVNAKGEQLAFVAPFTPGQISMALHYQGLIERHAAGGMKGASVEVRAVASVGGGDGGGFIEALLSESREIEMIRRRIGSGLALEVQRGKGARRSIPARALVDMVVLGGMDLTAVLRAHGWAKDATILRTLRQQLSDALDRMQGYPQKAS